MVILLLNSLLAIGGGEEERRLVDLLASPQVKKGAPVVTGTLKFSKCDGYAIRGAAARA